MSGIVLIGRLELVKAKKPPESLMLFILGEFYSTAIF
jgi:hypothetical protein